MRAVAGRPIRVRFRIETEDGFLTDVDDTTDVEVVVADGAGVQIDTGTAARESEGVYTYTLSAQTHLDTLTAFAGFTVDGETGTLSESIRLVDRRVVPLSVLRQIDTLADLSVLEFLAAVDRAEDWATSILNFSPVLTGDRVQFRAKDYSARLRVPGIHYGHDVYSMKRENVTLVPEELTNVAWRMDALERTDVSYAAPYDPLLGCYAGAWIPGVYTAHVSHGLAECPLDLAGAIQALAKHVGRLSPSSAGNAYPDRATRIMTEASEIWLATPDGDKRFTGLPEVDGILARHRIATPFTEDSGSF